MYEANNLAANNSELGVKHPSQNKQVKGVFLYPI